MTPLAAQLREEAATLGRLLGHPVVTCPGAAGVLNPTSRAVVRVYDAVDLPDLVRQLSSVPLRPHLMVLAGVAVSGPELAGAGWAEQGVVVHAAAPVDLPWPARHPVRVVQEGDLPAVRRLLDAAFADDATEDYLPAGTTLVPGLTLLLGLRDGAPAGVVGVRLLATEALVFGLGVPPSARREGLGLSLLAGAAQVARAAGRDALVVHAEEPSLPFWLAAGFRETSRWRSWGAP